MANSLAKLRQTTVNQFQAKSFARTTDLLAAVF